MVNLVGIACERKFGISLIMLNIIYLVCSFYIIFCMSVLLLALITTVFYFPLYNQKIHPKFIQQKKVEPQRKQKAKAKPS